MRTFPLLAAVLFLSTSAPRPAQAQDEEDGGKKKGLPGLPSRYIDCIQPLTLDILLSAPPSQWGFGGEMSKTAFDRIYGIQLCRAYVEDMRHYCSQIGNVPGRGRERQMFDKMGFDCARDSALLQTHVALRSEGQIPLAPRCQDWCELEQAPEGKKLDCAEFCKKIMPLLPARVTDACKVYVEQTAPFHQGDPDYMADAAAECRMKLAPSPANCTDLFGPLAKKSCADHYAVLEAVRKKDPKLCPKSLRFAAVCAAMTAPDAKSAAQMCLTATRALTVPFCKGLKESGGLQDATKLPGDPDDKAEW